MNITDVRVRKVAKEGKMKAVVSITIDEEFVVHDIKVIEGEKGLFIAMPSRKATDGEYRDIAHPINSSTRDKIQTIILEKYQELKTKDGTKDIADLTKIFNADGSLIDTSNNATAAKEQQEALDAIAAAYGYEGSTNEFLNLYITSPTDTTKQLTMQQLLGNMRSGTGDQLLPADGSAITMEGRYFEGTTVVFNKDTAKLESVGGSTTNLGINAAFSQLGGNFSDITIDLSECTNYDNKGTSTIGATSGDLDGPGTGCGRRLGDMIGVSIQKDGMIYASYDNGMTKLLGQIATAAFANASGLEKEGDNLYSATLNSGEFDGIGVDITAGGGYMSTGQLEMSNVDLSSEFTEMITTQRGFQANSRIITVSDTLLEELTNLKR